VGGASSLKLFLPAVLDLFPIALKRAVGMEVGAVVVVVALQALALGHAAGEREFHLVPALELLGLVHCLGAGLGGEVR
jgi:hypothetical protein